MSNDRYARITAELDLLRAGGQVTDLVTEATPRPVVIYRSVPCFAGTPHPKCMDVLVPVPDGYPASHIDGAALPTGNDLLPRLAGGTNSQGTFSADGHQWTLASYHPHQNGGGPPWDPTKHGFHTYLDHVVAWLAAVK